MKKILNFIFTLLLISCSNESQENNSELDNKNYITVATLNGKDEEVEIEVPYNPKRIAILDMAAFDILDSLNEADRVVGSARGDNIVYLNKYLENKDLENIGTIKEADIEKIIALDVDVIFIGRRLRDSYDILSEIAPVICLAVDGKTGVVDGVRKNALTIAKLFGKESLVNELMSGFDSRIKKLNDFAKDKTAIVGITSAGSFSVLGSDGRCSLITKEVGFKNVGISDTSSTSTHGNEASFEFVVDKDPDYMFILDRDTAIGRKPSKSSKELIENELIVNTDVYKDGNIIYLENPTIWYIAEGGIKALDIMISDLEKEVLENN